MHTELLYHLYGEGGLCWLFHGQTLWREVFMETQGGDGDAVSSQGVPTKDAAARSLPGKLNGVTLVQMF